MRRRRVTVDVTKAGRRLLDAITSHDVQKVRRVLAAVPDSQRKAVVNSCVWLPEAAGVCGPMPIACVLAGQPSEPKVRAKMFDALLHNRSGASRNCFDGSVYRPNPPAFSADDMSTT